MAAIQTEKISRNPTVEALQAWNAHPPHLPMKIPCPFPPSGPEWKATPKCQSVLMFTPSRARMSVRQQARSVVRSHLLRHYQLRTRERSLLLDDAVEGL